MLLIIDNYDSFTYNLYQGFATLNPDVKVVKNDAITIEEIAALKPSGIVLSPGPGRPEQAGICLDVIRAFQGKIPILGVCLGHQALGLVFGATVKRAGEIVHGKECLIFHSRKGLFQGMSLPFQAARYHSLIVDDVPADLIVDATSPEGLVMAMHHKTMPLFGVQFHPESILTPEGALIMKNFLEVCHAPIS
ncbi:MAG: aminodeoxychorismate/anthranilate synthase component II [Verrucomicrobia bacterium]|nr:aminodeoxychorismate/anthranilate synthase component II [Verrucomicrobiota bacterium]MBU6446361.1 aminodeoxychorismate/anthranilate synthase component II [Verrucomicrobiota bacterium]MDE3047885.1 aminodeoxychorismate/anthranilate synthase component II [Verrucomicrobiota bacterium]